MLKVFIKRKKENAKPFDKWRKALEKTVKVEIDEEAWSRLYKHISHPISYKQGKKIAVRVISQFGEESTKLIEL